MKLSNCLNIKLSNCLLFLIIALLFSCQKSSVTPATTTPNDEEVITTAILTLTSGTKTETWSFKDLDGDGANAPIIINDTVTKNTVYTTNLKFLNQSVSPEEDITQEVLTEATDHQVFYGLSRDITLFEFTYTDKDANGKPLGLKGEIKFTTTKTGYIDVPIKLIHKPNKSATGVADGNSSNAGGTTDLEVLFRFHLR